MAEYNFIAILCGKFNFWKDPNLDEQLKEDYLDWIYIDSFNWAITKVRLISLRYFQLNDFV